jgi:hypothetical protein
MGFKTFENDFLKTIYINFDIVVFFYNQDFKRFFENFCHNCFINNPSKAVP